MGVVNEIRHIIKRIIHAALVALNITLILVLGMVMSLVYDRGLKLLEEQDVDGIKYIIAGTLVCYIMYKIHSRITNRRIKEGRRQKNERYKDEIK